MDAGNNKRVNDLTRTARAEASVWIVRLHGPHRTPELEAGFRAWLTASPENARQFERVTEVWDAGAVPVAGMPRVAREPERSPPRRWLLAASLALAIIGAGSWGASTFWLNPHYGTGMGERRVVRLSDGSQLTLNSDSEVIVSYRHDERRVRIDHGEAFFEVAKDATKPFRVRAGKRQVEAVGTAFAVKRDERQLTVTLVEGKVAVSGLDRSGASATSAVWNGEPLGDRILLTAGQRLTVSQSGSAPQLDRPRLDMATAWLRGEVILDGTPLAEVIAEMNRYDQRRLVIDDPAIAAVRISGIYHTGNSELFAAMVARLYGFGVRQKDGRIHLFAPVETVTAGK
jgi:transmembrane sensor